MIDEIEKKIKKIKNYDDYPENVLGWFFISFVVSAVFILINLILGLIVSFIAMIKLFYEINSSIQAGWQMRRDIYWILSELNK